MSSLHYEKKHKPSGGKGFYIALGVCLIAIGVASWTTYDSVVKFTEEESSSSSYTQSTQQTQNNVEGVPISSSEEPESSSESVQEEKEVSAQPEKEPEIVVSNTEPSEPTAVKPESTPETSSESTEPENVVYSFPVGNTVTKNFSGENPIFSETMQDWRVHSGVDLGANNGDAIAAIAAGKVIKSYKDDLYGNVLVIEHAGGITAYYCGLGDTLLVKEGAEVTAGQKIGSVSTVPCESAERPHLHLELKKDDKFVDPLTILTEG